MLPTTDFFGHEVTRLIIGDNPFNGHSYITDVITQEELLAYHTEERIIEALFTTQQAGFNTLLPLGDPFILRTLQHFSQRGGRLQAIFQPYTAIGLELNLRMMKDTNAIGAYHQGTTTDFLFENGQTDTIRQNLKILRESGLPVGLGTHRPDVIELAESENWDVDFYVACLQNARRGREGEQSGFITGKTKQGLRFFPEDRPIMLDLIAKVDKPCIAFKIFAGGQIFYGHSPEEIPDVVRNVYREVFSKLKPSDIAAVGVYQGTKDQIGENARLFREVMQEMSLSPAAVNSQSDVKEG